MRGPRQGWAQGRGHPRLQPESPGFGDRYFSGLEAYEAPRVDERDERNLASSLGATADGDGGRARLLESPVLETGNFSDLVACSAVTRRASLTASAGVTGFGDR